MFAKQVRRPAGKGNAGDHICRTKQHTRLAVIFGVAFLVLSLAQVPVYSALFAQQPSDAVRAASAPQPLPPRVLQAQHFLAQRGLVAGAIAFRRVSQRRIQAR